MHIIPPGEIPIVVNEPKTFSVVLKHYEPLDESTKIGVSSSHPNIKLRETPLVLKRLLDGDKIGRTTFTVEGAKVGAEAFVEARSNGYSKAVSVKVVEEPPPVNLPDGLSFENPRYHLALNKEKSLTLWLKKDVSKPTDQILASIVSDKPDIVVLGGGSCRLRRTDIEGLYTGKVRIIGRSTKTSGTITATLESLRAQTRIAVGERKDTSSARFKFDPDDEDYGAVRYKWDIQDPHHHVLIGTRHPSINRYLGVYTGSGWTGLKSTQCCTGTCGSNR